MVEQDHIVAVWFSCGAASAVAAMIALEKYSRFADVRIINNPVAEEDSDNRRFLKDVEKWLGVTIEIATNKNFPSCSAYDVWDAKKYMSGVAGAPCTLELKKIARQQWEKKHKPDWHVLGFTHEEKRRADNFIRGERENMIPVLVDEGITKSECFRIIRNAGIELPLAYRLGYPNANCIGCVKATSPTYWNHVRKNHPDVFESRCKQSRSIGSKLVRVRGKRIFLDELLVSDIGRPMKGMDVECGIFCEEKL